MCGQQPDGPLHRRVGKNIGGTRGIREEEINRDKLAYDVIKRPVLVVQLHGQLHHNFNNIFITIVFPHTSRGMCQVTWQMSREGRDRRLAGLPIVRI
jgi:hypothetical protein